MFTKQNKETTYNIFVEKEQIHNFIVLFFSIILICISIVFLYGCLKTNNWIEIFLVIIFFLFACFELVTSSLLIKNLKKIKNDLKPERLNLYIYQSSWMRKKIATIWTALSYFTIVFWFFIIYLIVGFSNQNINKFVLIFYGVILISIILIAFFNYKIISNYLNSGERYISTKKNNSYENILEAKQWHYFYKKIYLYLIFCLVIFPWFLMLNANFRKKINNN